MYQDTALKMWYNTDNHPSLLFDISSVARRHDGSENDW